MKVGWLFVIIFFVVFSTDVQAYNSRLTHEQIEEAIEFGRNHTDLLPFFVPLPVSGDPLENLTWWEERELAKAEEELAKLEREATSQPEPSEKKSLLSGLAAALPGTLEQQIKRKKEEVEKLRQELEDAIALRRLWEERQDLEWVEVAVSFKNYFARIDPSIQSHPLCVVIVSSPFLTVASFAARYHRLLDSELGRQVLMNGVADILDVMHAKGDYLGIIVLFDTVFLTHARLRILDSPFDLIPPKFSEENIPDRNYYAFPLSVKNSKTGGDVDLSNRKVELLLFTREGEQFNCYFDLSEIR